MIVDTSALIAILRDEPEARAFAIAIAESDCRRLSAANYLETAIVIDGSRDPVASRRFQDRRDPTLGFGFTRCCSSFCRADSHLVVRNFAYLV